MKKYGVVRAQRKPSTTTALFSLLSIWQIGFESAAVAKLADAQDLGSCPERVGGSSPSGRIFLQWKSATS